MKGWLLMETIHPDWTETTVEVNGIGLHVTRTGGDKPALVLAHGFTDDGSCWNALAQPLARDYDVVMYDARGHGLSELGSEFTWQALADDLTGVIEALGLDKPGVIGHSMGAFTAALAGSRPDLVKFVVLEDPPWFTEGERPSFSWRENSIALKAQTAEERIANARPNHPRWSDAEWGTWARSKERLNLGVYELGGPPGVSHWRETVPRIQVPALLITGSDSGAIITPEVAQEAQSLNSRIQVAQIAGAAHCIRRDQGSAYWDVLKAFLDAQR